MSLTFRAPRRRKETLGSPGETGCIWPPPPPHLDSSSHSPVDGAQAGVRGPFLKLRPPWVPRGLPLSSWSHLGLNEWVTLAQAAPSLSGDALTFSLAGAVEQ